MLNRKLTCLLVTCLIAVGSTSSSAQTSAPTPSVRNAPGVNKVALVIGNAAYRNSPLINPVNDARAVATKLRSLGFQVIEHEDLKQKELGSVLREFRTSLKPGAIAIFFYAGHGVQIKGINYLPVVDADISSEEDVPTQSLDVGKVLELMDEAKTQVNLVFLDACRNNPFARSFRSAGDGLAKVNAPSGTIISFATRPGSVAADSGSGHNGLYTEFLLKAMEQGNQPIEQALKQVVSGVKRSSSGKQEPWMEGSIEGDFCFGQCGQGAVAISQEDVEQQLWSSIENSTDIKDFENYLNSYPKGRFVPLARQKMKNPPAETVPSRPTPDRPLTCAKPATLTMPAGVNMQRLEMLDNGEHYKVYTQVEASDDRDPSKTVFPSGMSKIVDLTPSALNRIFSDIILRSRRFKVYDMSTTGTPDHSSVLVTAKFVDADQVLRPYLEGGRRVSESRVRLSVQVKNIKTGENLLSSDVFVEGKTGMTSGDRVVITSADDVNSSEIREKLAVDLKNAVYRALSKANDRIEELLRPMARVVSGEDCQIDLFGGSEMGLQPKDELVVFRSQKRQLGNTTILSNTRAIALILCTGVGTDASQCSVEKSVGDYRPQDGDYAILTDESLQTTRMQ